MGSYNPVPYIPGQILSAQELNLMRLIDNAVATSFQLTSGIVRNGDGVLLSANITWPDGVTGVYTTDVVNSLFPVIDGWHATYLNSTTGNQTVTQPTITRDSNGAVSIQPNLTVT